MSQAETKFLKNLQRGIFRSEQEPKLAMTQTFTVDDGLLRLKTKTAERNDKFTFLYPVLLDSKHRAVELLIREVHESLCHASIHTVMSHLRKKFWILSMKKTVRSIVHKCIVCKKQNAKRMETNPPRLSIHRVKDTVVFQVSGVDFVGQYFCVDNRRRGFVYLLVLCIERSTLNL